MAFPLVYDLKTIQQQAQEDAVDNAAFRHFVKRRLTWTDRQFSTFVYGIAREVSAAIDCTQCGNCCRALSVGVDPEDLVRLADHLQEELGELQARDSFIDPQHGLTLCAPCPYQCGNLCGVYTARPETCRQYPHLLQGDMRIRLSHLVDHAENCPIYFNVLERMKGLLDWEEEAGEEDEPYEDAGATNRSRRHSATQ
jgi:Fe-S-cluster containining protein